MYWSSKSLVASPTSLGPFVGGASRSMSAYSEGLVKAGSSGPSVPMMFMSTGVVTRSDVDGELSTKAVLILLTIRNDCSV